MRPRVWSKDRQKNPVMINEPDLIRQLQNEKTREQAFTLLVREYQEPLYWQIRRIVLKHDDSDDVLQNTFIKAWVNLEDFRGESRIYTWLSRIAINEALNHMQRSRQNASLDDAESSVVLTLQSDPYFDGDKTQLQLQEAISKLPAKQRVVFNMKYFQEMKYEDMSEALGTSIGALKASYHHAVKKITEFFERQD